MSIYNDVVSVFLPCRAGSERVIRKNVRPFSPQGESLLQIKLRQLILAEKVKTIYLSTNDAEVVEQAADFECDKLEIIIRDESLCRSTTSTDDLIKYVPRIISGKYIMWTHVTSPFIDQVMYDKMISKYFDLDNREHDSLMSVTSHIGFFWNESGPITYDKSVEKWPRTQTIEKIYEINSGCFIYNRESYVNNSDRIGERPFFYDCDPVLSMDIDWEKDFKYASEIYKMRGC